MSYLCHADAWRAMMGQHDGKTYRPWEPQRYQHEAHSPAAKLPEGDLVFFLLDTVPRLDWCRFYAPYATETRGAPPFDPAMMVCLLLYAYCVGVFASRKIAPWPANAIWPSSPSWARSVRTFVRSAISVSSIWWRSKTSLCRWCVWREKQGW